MFRWRVAWRAATTVIAVLALGAAVVARAADDAPDAKPEDVVKTYLTAMQKGDYATAYRLLTPEMRNNLDEKKWIAQQVLVMKLADVQIDSFEVFPARMQGENEAIVPNLLKSKDKFINQTGANEYELYTLVRGPEKEWRIALQQLVETDAVAKWFPPTVKAE